MTYILFDFIELSLYAYWAICNDFILVYLYLWQSQYIK